MKKTTLIAAFWIVSLVVVFVMGKKSVPEPVEPVVEDTDWKPAGRKLVVKKAKASDTASAAEAEEPKTKIIREVVYEPVPYKERYASVDIAQELPAALNSKDVLGRNLEIAKMLASLNRDNIDAALKAFEETPRDYRNDDYFRMFMYAWGEISGKEAVDYAFFNEDGKKVRWGGTSAMTAWATRDPAEAKAYLETIEADESKNYMEYGLVRGWAKKDLSGAASYVETMENGRERYRFVDVLTERYLEDHGPEGALQWASQVSSSSDPEYASMVFNRVTAEVAEQDPAKAAAFLDRNSDSEQLGSRTFAEVADEWAERDPQSAANWLSGYFDDERVTGEVVSRMTSEWAETDPNGAATWMNQNMNTGKITDDAVGRVAGEWAKEDPNATLKWLSGLQDEDMLSRGYASAMDQWARNDLTAAGEYLNSITRTEVHDGAIASYTRRLAREDPVVALGWAAQIKNDERRERSTIETARSLHRENPEAVQEWLPTSGLSEEAQQSILNPPRRDWRGRGGRGGGR